MPLSLLLTLAALASGELTGLEFRGHQMNFPAEVAHIIQRGDGKLSEVCTMEPEFVPAEKFYVLSCAHTALVVDIVLHGDSLFMNGGAIPNNVITVELPEYQEPHIRYVTSCPNGTYQPNSDCNKITLDIYRDGGDWGTLSTLGIASSNALALFMTPNFQPHVLEYETKVRLGEPFSITASSAEYKTLVGIEYKGTAGLSGLGDQDGCKRGTRKHMKWDLPGFDAVGMHPFDVCAIAPDHEHMLKYRLNVTVEPLYSEELKSIKAEPFPLTEKFDPHHSTYEVRLPQERFRQVTTVTISVEANDTEAKISFSDDLGPVGTAKSGTNSAVVKTRVLSETPVWTISLNIKVTSADDRKSKSYFVNVRQEVSTFCELRNITVGETACVLTPLIEPVGFWTQGVKHPDFDGFNPNHTLYKCIWEQSTGKSPQIIAHKDTDKCKYCTVWVPDPASQKERHLSIQLMNMDRITWKELVRANKHKEPYWTREFLYGEYHTLPIQVISADKFTDCTYRVYLERWAPWYMRVQTTRFVSRTAMTLSSLMSFTGAANFMALAKQVQFMMLTIAIHGIPEVYRDFAHALKVFDLDVSGFVPDVGLPSQADFVRFKEKMLGNLQAALGITQARLLVHYCYAKKFHGRFGGNAILFSHPNDTKVLLEETAARARRNKTAGDTDGKDGDKDGDSEGAEESDKEGDKGKGQAEDGTAATSKGKARRLRGAQVRERRLQEADAETPAFTPRRLSLEEELEDELEEDDEEEEQEYPDIWVWSGDEWDDLFDTAKNASITENSYRDMSCSDHPLVHQVLNAFVVMHQMSEFRNMIESTTGSFLIVIVGGGIMGALYIVYWKLIMQHSQRRLKVFEPGPFWIFVADYTLISFSKVAATLAFQDKMITFFVWKPNRLTIQVACIFGIIMYPLAFTAFVMWSICKLTGKLSKPGDQAKLIYNTKSGQWLDPTCNNMRVTVEAKVPRSIPLIPQLLTKHVRACVPILDQEGDTLTFGDDDEEDEAGKKVDPASKLRAERKKNQKEDKAATERELRRMDEAIQAELAALSSEHNAKHRRMKEERLKREAALAHKVNEWKQRHAVAISKRRQVLREQTSKTESNSEPPWFAIATKNSHRGRSWIGGWGSSSSSSADEVVEKNPYYMNLKLNDLIDMWQPHKHRNDNEVLDNEERFSILQYIENHIREERKLLKYNILTVVPDSGYLKPREPLKQEREVQVGERVGSLGLTIQKGSSAPAMVSNVSPGTWAADHHIMVGNEIIALNGSNVTSKQEAEIMRELESTRPLRLTLHPGKSALPKLWLPDEHEYLRDDYEYGQHPWVEEFSAGSNFIENDRNERLVYTGDVGTCCRLSSLKTGHGVRAGKCQWMGEPDVGWPIWERQNLHEMGATNSTVRYADKWQWIVCDFCELPWCKDESSEAVVHCGCLGTLRKASLPFHAELRKALCVTYQNHVPSQVSPAEKIEIRKWMWGKLKTPMEIKLKLSFLADQHPKFYRAQTLADVAVKDFHTVIFGIETAKPNDDWLRDFGKSQFSHPPAQQLKDTKEEHTQEHKQEHKHEHKHERKHERKHEPKHEPKQEPTQEHKEEHKEEDRELEKERQRETREKGAAVQINQLELLEYTLMKLEDLYPFDGEPWWAEADARAKDKGEIKVMFDHDIFWRGHGDPKLVEVRRDNSLIPANGYYSSAMFMEHPGEAVGTKRYRIVKPDDSMTPINCVMTMGHILPLMRYTENFKLNVPIDALDLPHRSMWQIVLGDKKRGEEFNYCVDRGTTLISIICICAQVGGLRTALIFAAMKFITLVNCVWTAYKASSVEGEEEEEEYEVDQQVQIPLKEEGTEKEPLLSAESGARLGVSNKSLNSQGEEVEPPSIFNKLVQACLQVDAGVLVLQTLTLLLLAFGQANMPVGLRMQESLCALACVLVCSTTMVFTNIFTFQKETKKLAEEGTEWVKGTQTATRSMNRKMNEVLAGENIFGIEFVTSEQEETEQVIKAEKVSIVVPDLGIHFEGEPDIDESMPIDEIRQMEMLKQVAFFVMQRESADDVRPLSARDLPRYDKDIHKSLAVALSIEQMMLCAKIPQVVATIQCVNHVNSNLSRPAYDNYLTLFKPDDWEPEFDQDKKRVQGMLELWKVQVREWFRDSLGAVMSERTCTRKIEEQLFNLLRRECTGSLYRDLFAIRIKQVSIPAHGSFKCADLKGKVGYVTVLYDNENLKSDFPEDRTSGFGKFQGYLGPSSSSTPVLEETVDEEEEEIPYSARRRAPLKRGNKLALSMVVDSMLLVEMPLGATKVRFVLWAQVAEGLEEVVAFSSEVDLVNRAEYGQEQVLEFYMHTHWKHSRGHSVAPLGGEDLEDEDAARNQKLAEDEEEVKSGCQRCLDRFTSGLKSCVTCCRRRQAPEDILSTKGIIEVQMRKATAAEQEEDFKMMMAVQDSTEGQSSLTLSKLDRHKDQFVELAAFFGIRLWEADVQGLKEHVEKMRRVNSELWPSSERRKSAAERARGLVERQKTVLGYGIRRQLEDCEEMERAIENLNFGIQKVEEQLKKEKEAGVNPQQAYLIKKKFVSGRQVHHEKTEQDLSDLHKATSTVLLDELVKFRVRKTKSAKSILHYVVISDHLKPGKNWRPDAIVPHVASIVTNDMDDVPEVRLIGGKRRDGMPDVVFKRQLKEGSNHEPVILNGRLVFKAEGQVFPELTKQTWLYWDGNARWVVSPNYGVPVPYGLDQHTDYAAQFMWSKDTAVTPDKITQPWMIWARSSGGMTVERRTAENTAHPKRWASDLTLRIDGGHNTVNKRRRKFESFAKTEADNDEGGIGSAIGGVFKEAAGEIVSLFSQSGHNQTDSCLHECLISMDSSYLSFAWKDLSIERLSSFRKFLLNEFGTYQSAWLYITRQITMPRPLGQRNLANIFRLTLDLIELDDKERELEREEEEARMQEESVFSPSVGSPTSARKKMLQRKKTGGMGSSNALGSSTNLGGERGTFHMSERSMGSQHNLGEHSMPMTGTLASSATMRSNVTRFSPEAKEPLRAFLTRKRAWDKNRANKVVPTFSWINRGGRKPTINGAKLPSTVDVDFDQLAAHIMDLLDKPPKDGSISIEEIRSLYDDQPEEGLLKEFKDWLKVHPTYCDIEYFWEFLSEDVEISLEDFKASTERLMLKFRTVKRQEVQGGSSTELGAEEPTSPRNGADPPVLTAAEKAEHVFADLDAQNMSGGISYREIRPFSGEHFEDADKSMLHFKIPLTHVKEIVCQGHLKKFSSDKRCIRFHINEQFENHKPWRDFRLALNPDWEPARNNESVQVCMLPQLYDLWKQVIRESEMIVPQEWVRYYEGEYKEHPLLMGTYMRHGEGLQRWANGQVYAGGWVNHLYEGYGTLWSSMTDYTSKKALPIYDGQWERGKQHGEGTLRYEQDIFDRRGKPALTRGQHSGRSKIYRGRFRDGLFHGKGILKMERAVAQYQSGPSRSGPDACVGFVPAAILEPASIISFDGIFESDWESTDKEIREADPVYNAHNPVSKMDLKLEALRRSDRRGDLFKRYFAVDKSKVQKSGASPPDLAVTAYQLKGGDAIHMKHAMTCLYADGTEYSGPMLRGKPHVKSENVAEGVPSEDGKGGTLTQYEVQPDGVRGEWLAVYTGQFDSGERHGVGRHETWDQVVYEGQWMRNKRHGEGEQRVPEAMHQTLGFSLYTGQWEKDKKHGQGKMHFGDEGNLLYEGAFENDLRHGDGNIYLIQHKEGKRSTKPPQLLYKGKFQDDVPHTNSDEKVWTHLVVAGDKRGRFFYGQLDDEGKRCGEGTIYDEDADESHEFMECFNEGRPYPKEDTTDASTWKYITYHGPFKNDLPHGEGRQHFRIRSDKKRSGFYTGQFVEGKRHGRGEWVTKDGKRKYRPISAAHVANWDNDLMHGIAIVEDKDHVHENVIYAHGRCQMPFTDMGPPLTGFDNTFVVGGLVKATRMTKMRMRGDAPRKQEGPGASIASSKKKQSFFGFGREDHAQGVNRDETQAVQQITATTRAAHLRANGGPAIARSEEEQELVVVGLVREDTDLSLPEEDVFIKGGTGENAVMNGLYFKLSGTYGMPIYKMAKRDHRAVYVRYLFKDIKSNCWVISPKTNSGLVMAAACAFVDDDEADKPGAITADWYVWYPPKKAMKCYGEDEGIDPQRPLDRITAVSIVGFDVSGVDRTLVSPGIMLRHAKELYGRPVYEAESGNQFLYWMRKKGSLAQGMIEDDSEFSGASINHDKLFEKAGYWIISSEVGELVDSPKCLAYVEDLAVTPNLINPAMPWNVATSTDGKHTFHKSAQLRLTPEEWSRNATLLDTFDDDERMFGSEARTMASSS